MDTDLVYGILDLVRKASANGLKQTIEDYAVILIVFAIIFIVQLVLTAYLVYTISKKEVSNKKALELIDGKLNILLSSVKRMESREANRIGKELEALKNSNSKESPSSNSKESYSIKNTDSSKVSDKEELNNELPKKQNKNKRSKFYYNRGLKAPNRVNKTKR